MLDGFKTVKDISERWGITDRAVRNMCAQGKLKGAKKIGRDWILPDDTERPVDGRVTSGKYVNWRTQEKSVNK